MRITRSKLAKPIAVLFFLCSALIVQGCGHNTRTAKVASHNVTVDRAGITHRFGVEERDKLAIFHYDGYTLTGGRMIVTIENDKVSVDDKVVGMLNPGDTVHINADGLTVNSLDHGQTEKYLKANVKVETAQTN